MNEFGEEVTIYVWPKDHEEGEPYGDDWYERLTRALATENIEYEAL